MKNKRYKTILKTEIDKERSDGEDTRIIQQNYSVVTVVDETPAD